MSHSGQFHKARTKSVTSMCQNDSEKCGETKNPSQKIIAFNLYYFILMFCLSLQTVNSNTTNMNRHLNTNKGVVKTIIHDKQSDAPNEDNYEDHEHASENIDYSKVNFDQNPYYSSEDFIHKFYNNENSYSNYEDYKKYYLNPSNPLPKANVKFKISSRIVQTKYGKLQGIVLAMDEHRYLSPLEVFLGVPYATPPVASNR